MADQLGTNSSELANWLRRWLVLGGYCLAAWELLNTVVAAFAWRRLPFNFYYRTRPLTLGHRLVSGLGLASLLLLPAGCWGFHHHRRWARPVLLTYAGIWIAVWLGQAALVFTDVVSNSHFQRTFLKEFAVALSELDQGVYASVYAVALVLCLTRPELRDQSPATRRGFEPIFRDNAGAD